jgi:flagellar M-ring protein FliF
MTATLREPMLLAAGTTKTFEEFGEGMLPGQNDSAEEMLLPRSKSKTHQLQQGIFEHVSDHIRREPAQSTRLLEAWIGSPEERD